jgi:hypothetical protein
MSLISLVFVFPALWPFIAKAIWKREIRLLELGFGFLVAIVIGGLLYLAGTGFKTADTEVWNGEVLSKVKEKVSCSHSYSCNCRPTTSCSGSGKDRVCSTTTVCDTCYEHAYDVDWTLKTNLGEIDIDRIDRQGVKEPPRFTIAKAGDPVAKTRYFTNYVKAVPESLFNFDRGGDPTLFSGKIVQYPLQVYDYHYLDRVFAVGLTVPDLPQWNRGLAEILKTLGPSKQANAVVIIVNEANPAYAYAVQRAWLGGKKNDVMVFIGSTDYPKIDWVQVLSWSDKEDFKVVLRDSIMDIGTVDREKILGAIKENTSKLFVRKRMRDYEYLKYEIEPPIWALVLGILVGVACSIGITIFFVRERQGYRRMYGSRY